MSQQKKRVLLAPWVIPVSSPPIRNGAIVVSDGLVSWMGSEEQLAISTDAYEPVRFDGVLTPGFINVHTHLEFSSLDEPLGHHGISLPKWIGELMPYRMSLTDASKRIAIERGLKELAANGTVAVGEIATAPFDIADYQKIEPQIHKTLFAEQLTTDVNLISDRCADAKAHVAAQIRCSDMAVCGLSPHAPYSVHPQLLKRLLEIGHRAPVAMHVAETLEELQLLETQTGEFVDLLKKLGAWRPEAYSLGYNIDSIIEELALSPQPLLVHGNYLSKSQLRLAAKRNISVAYCPRTHRWFDHSAWPLRAAIDLGVNVSIGTDSRASNPDLSLLEELKTVSQGHPNVTPKEILKLGTSNGAKALGIASRYGTIEAGKPSMFAHVFVNAPNASEEATDPYWWLQSADSKSESACFT
jgi:cytosine/adenosine deaminase-related metal-dependent hydrolase